MAAILAIIPARGGSKRIPKKNLKKFLGKEIVSYPIDSAKSADVDRVFVSTDSKEIADVAIRCGAEVPFLRSDRNSDDYATTYDVVSEVLNKLGIKRGIVVCVYPTSVFVTPELINKAVSILEDDPEISSVCTVQQFPHPIQRAFGIEGGRLNLIDESCYSKRTQDLPLRYYDSGQLYVFRAESIHDDQRVITRNCKPIVIGEDEAHDIDDETDWEIAEQRFIQRRGS